MNIVDVLMISQKKVVIISIMMQSSNQHANTIESIVGVFLYSCRTPDNVVNALQRMGLSVSVNSIHNAITSLSRESANTLQSMGQTLLVAYAYDNFDVNLKPAVPTVEKATDTLKHLTSGLIFPLQHDVTLEDLRCSKELWMKSPLNPHVSPHDLPSECTWDKLLTIHPDPLPPNPIHMDKQGLLSRHDRFNSWMFLQDLCLHGPEYFRKFLPHIEKPEVVDAIPVTKTPIIPTRAMDAENSSVSGNIKSIKELLAQGGVGSRDDEESPYEVKDIDDHVILFHGDLGTGERIHTALAQRSIEKSPWNRLQYAIFVLGLFHLKMACVDALLRIFITPTAARLDDTGLMGDVGKTRPKETGIIASSNPGYRRSLQIIQDSGRCRRLTCWVNAVEEMEKHSSLDDFAASQPSLETLKTLADHLAMNYVAGGKLERKRRTMTDKERDKQLENGLLMNKYFLLFEEISYAMNHGDIGRVEVCMLPWILIFKSTGKHKYATHLTRYLFNVHFVYPKGLRQVPLLLPHDGAHI